MSIKSRPEPLGPTIAAFFVVMTLGCLLMCKIASHRQPELTRTERARLQNSLRVEAELQGIKDYAWGRG